MSYGKTLCQQRCHLSCWVKVGDWPEEDSMFAFAFSLALEVARDIVLAAAWE
jgi:hypothetical protein